ncbi:OsmC family protein [Nitriliruptor alkaliphilus]|uniref:OsmC family protein n=1 Tax=Nitriliruptor alkaliphilus TaxID=427918 RepID=UPI0006962FA4|nr:OsmC family protein [Nitriliruptor alkaliphilus]
MADHTYRVHVEWTGNTGEGTASYRSYGRDHRIAIEGKPDLLASSDPSFRGDPSRHNPEDLLVAALSGCHLLWYLHECSTAGAVVVSYRDEAVGTMVTDRDGGRFSEVVLRPVVEVTDESMIPAAIEAHERAHAQCFIANSVNFPVRHEPTVTSA